MVCLVLSPKSVGSFFEKPLTQRTRRNTNTILRVTTGVELKRIILQTNTVVVNVLVARKEIRQRHLVRDTVSTKFAIIAATVVLEVSLFSVNIKHNWIRIP